MSILRRKPFERAPRAPVTPSRSLHRGTYGRIEKPAPVDATPAPARHARRRPSTLESAHMGAVKRLRCVLCAELGMPQESVTDVHHLREEQGGAQRAQHWLVAALCHDRCHQGTHGIHGDRLLLIQAKCTEIDLLAWTLRALAEGHT